MEHLPAFSIDNFGWVKATGNDGGFLQSQRVEAQLLLAILGYTIRTITHPFFGPEPVTVFAINCSRSETGEGTCASNGTDEKDSVSGTPSVKEG